MDMKKRVGHAVPNVCGLKKRADQADLKLKAAAGHRKVGALGPSFWQ